MRYFAMSLLLLTCASTHAQPLPDPFVAMEADWPVSFTAARLTMRDSVTADIFYVESRGTVSAPDNHIKHAVVSLTARQVIAGPEELPSTNDWNLTIGGVASRGSNGWIALLYEAQASYQDNWSLNRTWAVYGQNAFQGTLELDTGRTQQVTLPPFRCDIAHYNSEFSIGARVGGGWIASWVRNGCQVIMGAFAEPLNSIQLVSLLPNLNVDHRKSCCSSDYPDYGPWEVRSVSADHDTMVVLSMDWSLNGAGEPFPVLMRWESLSGDCTMSHFHGAVVYDIERTRGGRFLGLAARLGGLGGYTPYLLELDRVTGRTILDTLPFPSWNPTAFHPDYGFAFVKVMNQMLILARIDTTGNEVQPVGVFYQCGGIDAITDADVSVTDNGRVVVLWTEREDGTTDTRLMKAAWVGWTTYLGAHDRDFIPHPSSLSFSCSPNPFNARTEIRFTLPQAGKVSLDLFDITGRKVMTVLKGNLTAGEHAIPLDGSDLPTGIYFARILSAHGQTTLKLALIR